ncbi:MAG: nuclear transport factor 2 family protein [Gammaproteobacteria bacterium]
MSSTDNAGADSASQADAGERLEKKEGARPQPPRRVQFLTPQQGESLRLQAKAAEERLAQVTRQRNVALILALAAFALSYWAVALYEPGRGPDAAMAGSPDIKPGVGSDVVVINLHDGPQSPLAVTPKKEEPVGTVPETSSATSATSAMAVAPAAPASIEPETPVEPALPKDDPAPEAVANLDVGPKDSREPASGDALAPQPLTQSEAAASGPSLGVIHETPPSDLERRERILALVSEWANAWSSADVEGYLNSYAQGFEPGGGLDREQWAEQRRTRLKAPEWIKVEISGIDVSPGSNDFATVSFIQRYSAPGYADEVLKTLELVREDGRWLIISEVSAE